MFLWHQKRSEERGKREKERTGGRGERSLRPSSLTPYSNRSLPTASAKQVCSFLFFSFLLFSFQYLKVHMHELYAFICTLPQMENASRLHKCTFASQRAVAESERERNGSITVRLCLRPPCSILVKLNEFTEILFVRIAFLQLSFLTQQRAREVDNSQDQ